MALTRSLLTALLFFVVVPIAWFASQDPLLAGAVAMLFLLVAAATLRVSPLALALDLALALLGATFLGSLAQIFLYPERLPVAAAWIVGVLLGWVLVQRGAMAEAEAGAEKSADNRQAGPLRRIFRRGQRSAPSGT